MASVTSRELKNRTGDVLRRVRSGERIVVTNRGRAVAVISPARLGEPDTEGTRNPEEAWEEIEAALAASKPAFRTWQEAMDSTRRRR